MSLRQRLGLSADPVLLMDGSAYVFRSFYANQNMSRSDGMPTNVIYMVLRMLLKILREESPAHFAFILDGKGKNFRHRLFDDYKANRQATPEPLSMQIEPLVQAIKALGLFTTFSQDCEADDCIASLAARFAKERPVVIVGADKDLKQCLSPSVYIWDPSSKEERIITLASFTEEQGFGPERWPDYQAIVGDSSDNIPGVPGIGAKGANTLMRDFSSLDDLKERISSVPPALRKKLEPNFEQAFKSRELTTLKIDCCSEITLEDLAPRAPESTAIMQMLNDFELRSLARELASMLRLTDMTFKKAAAGGKNAQPAAQVQAPSQAPKSQTQKNGVSQSLPLFGSAPAPASCSGAPAEVNSANASTPNLADTAAAASPDSGNNFAQPSDITQRNSAYPPAEHLAEQYAPQVSAPLTLAFPGKAAPEVPENSSRSSDTASGTTAASSGSTSPASPGLPTASTQTPEERQASADRAARAESAQQNSFAWAQGSLLGAASPVQASSFMDKLKVYRGANSLPQAEVLALVLAKDAGGDKNDSRLILGDKKNSFILPELPPRDMLAELGGFMQGKGIIAAGIKNIFEHYPALHSMDVSKSFDLSIAAWLLSPEEYDYSLPKISRRWQGEAEAIIAGEAAEYTAETPCAVLFAMAQALQDGLQANELTPVLTKMEMPLIPILMKMQDTGIGIDRKAFATFLDEISGELARLTQSIYADAGKEFNIRSSRQLSDVLFETLKLQKSRKTSGGQISTSQEALEKLVTKHQIIEKLLNYRKLEKLRSTYLEPMPKMADAAARLHTSFNQSSTATGRLSSSNPNLQNIPVRGVHGTRMRSCFKAAEGKVLVSADYSQIELRVLAHLSQDPTLLDSFNKGEDIHTRTAALLFDALPDTITPDERRSAKTINFGLIYGMGPQKLAQDLKISMSEAKEFIARYFEKLDKLKEYFEQIEQEAQTHGFVSTMTGRRRPCPEIFSANQQMRSRARRQAINTCIQGSAADIIKLAMLAAASDKKLQELGAKLVLQIHDELLLECPEENAKAAGSRLARIMSAVKPGGVALSVPLSTDWGFGKTWADAH